VFRFVSVPVYMHCVFAAIVPVAIINDDITCESGEGDQQEWNEYKTLSCVDLYKTHKTRTHTQAKYGKKFFANISQN